MNKFITVKEASIKWNLSDRSVRNYCALGRVEGAVLSGKTWLIPDSATKPIRSNEKENKKYLLERLRFEKNNQIKGGIYHKLMIDLTYNSNHIEGNELTHDETRYIFETRTIGVEKDTSNLEYCDLNRTTRTYEKIRKAANSPFFMPSRMQRGKVE